MIDYEYASLFTTQNSVDKQFVIETTDGTVSITNEELSFESFTLTESLCSESELSFGRCEAAEVKFTVAASVGSLIDKVITVSIVLDGNTDDPFVLGKYKVVSDKPTADRSYREIVAYDALYDILNADVSSWYNALPFPISMKYFRTSFFQHFNIEEKTASLVNDNMTVEKTILTTETSATTIGESLSGADVIEAICEINGVFGHIGRDGKFEYIALNSNGSKTNISDLLYSGTAKYEDYNCRKITKVQIRTNENDIGAIVGQNGNEYIIQGNFLVYGKGSSELQTVAQNVLSVITTAIYTPLNCTVQGNPCIEVGDGILIQTESKSIASFVLNRTLKGIQALSDDYSAEGEGYFSEKVNGSHSSLTALKGRYNSLERTIEETQSRIGTIEEDYTKESVFTQTVDGITSQISSIEQEIDGSIQVYNTTDEPTLLNYPAWDFSFTIPCNDTVLCSEDLVLEYKPEYYQKFQRSVVYDENSLQTYKFARDPDTGAYYWRPETDSEFGVALEKISELTQTVDGISANVSSVTQTVTSQGTQISTNSSNITANANSIASEVSRATGAEQTLTSQIKQTAESLSLSVSDQKGSASITISITDSTTGDVKTITKTIELDADTINLSAADVINMIAGGTINLTSKNIAITSDNFTVDKNGNVVMRSATITGYLKPSNLTDGTTQISGDNITTGTIDADNVDVVNVVAKSVACENLTGETITGKKFNGGEIYISNGYYGLQVGSNGQTTIQRLFTLDGIDIRSSDANTGSYVDFSSKAQAQSGQDFGCRIIQTDVQKLSFFSQFAPGFPVGMCQVEFGNTSVDGVLNVSGNANVQGNISSNGIIYANGKDLDVTDGTTVFASPQDGVLWFMRRDTGNVYQLIGSTPSDTRLKKNIEDSEVNALDIIEQVRAIQFDWKANDEHVPLGFSANQLEEVIPEAVVEVKQKPGNEFETIKQIDTSKLSIYYMKAIQELNAKIEQLESKIKKMEER